MGGLGEIPLHPTSGWERVGGGGMVDVMECVESGRLVVLLWDLMKVLVGE